MSALMALADAYHAALDARNAHREGCTETNAGKWCARCESHKRTVHAAIAAYHRVRSIGGST